jgi:uncharacterized membrane protein
MRPVRPRTLAVLTAIVLVAAALRFGGLASKPLWLDEAMTALVALGRGPDDVPLGVARPLGDLAAIFSLDPASTWRDVVANLADPVIQHTHPPLFYVLAHAWLRWWSPAVGDLAWVLRALCAAFGVLAVGLIFGLTRSGFGDRAGLIAAAVAAVSPATVMLAQEARNYTLGIALMAGALWALVAIAGRLAQHRPPGLALWASWASLNALACYAHYHGILAVAAQAAALAVAAGRARAWRQLGWLLASGAAVGLAFLPWASILLEHSASPDMYWLATRPHAYLHDTLHAWRQMFAGIAWRRTPAPIPAVTQVLTLIFGIWVLAVVSLGLRRRWPTRPPGADALLLVIGLTLVATVAASIALKKNFLYELRYHFAYYPALAAILGWLVAALPLRRAPTWPRALLEPARPAILTALLVAGGANAIATDMGLMYPKITDVDRVSASLAAASAPPVLVLGGSGAYHETVLNLSYLLELSRMTPAAGATDFALVTRGDAETIFWKPAPPSIFWDGLARVRGVAHPPATLWVFSVGLATWDYPPRLEVTADDGERRSCAIDAREHERAREDHAADRVWRTPFRLYHCAPAVARGG